MPDTPTLRQIESMIESGMDENAILTHFGKAPIQTSGQIAAAGALSGGKSMLKGGIDEALGMIKAPFQHAMSEGDRLSNAPLGERIMGGVRAGTYGPLLDLINGTTGAVAHTGSNAYDAVANGNPESGGRAIVDLLAMIPAARGLGRMGLNPSMGETMGMLKKPAPPKPPLPAAPNIGPIAGRGPQMPPPRPKLLTSGPTQLPGDVINTVERAGNYYEPLNANFIQPLRALPPGPRLQLPAPRSSIPMGSSSLDLPPSGGMGMGTNAMPSTLDPHLAAWLEESLQGTGVPNAMQFNPEWPISASEMGKAAVKNALTQGKR